MSDLERHLVEGYARTAAFVFDAAESTRPVRSDWLNAVRDAASDLDRIATSPLAHPDDVARARLAMAALSHIWLTVEESEDVYLGDRKI